MPATVGIIVVVNIISQPFHRCLYLGVRYDIPVILTERKLGTVELCRHVTAAYKGNFMLAPTVHSSVMRWEWPKAISAYAVAVALKFDIS